MAYMVEDLRIEEAALCELDAGLLDELSGAYRSPRVALLACLVRRLAQRKE
jgi:hypothetical protein